MLFAIVVCSVGVSEYGNFAVQAQESLFNTGATNTAVFILGRKRSGSEYVAMVTS